MNKDTRGQREKKLEIRIGGGHYSRVLIKNDSPLNYSLNQIRTFVVVGGQKPPM